MYTNIIYCNMRNWFLLGARSFYPLCKSMQNSGGARAVVRHKCVPRTSPQSYAIMTDVQQPPGLRYVHHFSFNGSVYSWSFYSNELSRRYTTCDTCKRLNVLASRRAVNLESIVIFFFFCFLLVFISYL